MKTILSVDDQAAILKCYEQALSAEGYDVHTTTEPEKALELLKERDVDLIMLDVRMPNISGLEVYQALKERKKDTVPVLFVTAFPSSFSLEQDSMKELWEEQFADGNTDILYKPFKMNDLIDKVQGLIGPSNE